MVTDILSRAVLKLSETVV